MGKRYLARYKFVSAIAVTSDSGIVLDHAIACERGCQVHDEYRGDYFCYQVLAASKCVVPRMGCSDQGRST